MTTRTIPLDDSVTFDDTTDLVVIGLGAAGASAAIEARAGGAEVLVLERAAARVRCAAASSIWVAARGCKG